MSNEVGFTEANVRAICDVGQSTKVNTGKNQGYIGMAISTPVTSQLTEHPARWPRKGEKGIGDGSCSYGLEDGDDILMSNWNGTIIGPGHVSISCLIFSLSALGDLTKISYTDSTREPNLQPEDRVWDAIP